MAALAILAACTAPEERRSDLNIGYVQQPPPAARVEARPASPGADYGWIAGQWIWNGAAWQWKSGRYERIPTGYSEWVSGEWKPAAFKWYWQDGYWR